MRWPRATLVVMLAVAGLAEGDDAPATRVRVWRPDREEAVIFFVREHAPDLAGLIIRLKQVDRDEYEKAITELDGVREALAKLQEKDPERSDLALRAWKARSQVEFLAAQVARTPSPKLEKQLRQAIRNQIDVELSQQRYERDQVAARLQRLDDAIEHLDRNREQQANARYQTLVNKAQRSVKKPTSAEPPPTREAKLGTETK